VDWLDTPIDVARLVRVLDRPIVSNGNTRPRILHVDSNRDALTVVAKALGARAEVMSTDSIDEARRALASKRFDVAVLDVGLAVGTGFDLLHELRDREGSAIPLVVFSPQDANPAFAAQIRSALIKSRTSIDDLICSPNLDRARQPCCTRDHARPNLKGPQRPVNKGSDVGRRNAWIDGKARTAVVHDHGAIHDIGAVEEHFRSWQQDPYHLWRNQIGDSNEAPVHWIVINRDNHVGRRQRRPTDISVALSPIDPPRPPFLGWNPEPPEVYVTIPMPVMEGDPSQSASCGASTQYQPYSSE
jgi:CheY-like chemotaxis protein